MIRDLDLQEDHAWPQTWAVHLDFVATGTANAVLWWWDCDLPGLLTNDPAHNGTPQETHWAQALAALGPLDVAGPVDLDVLCDGYMLVWRGVPAAAGLARPLRDAWQDERADASAALDKLAKSSFVRKAAVQEAVLAVLCAPEEHGCSHAVVPWLLKLFFC